MSLRACSSVEVSASSKVCLMQTLFGSLRACSERWSIASLTAYLKTLLEMLKPCQKPLHELMMRLLLKKLAW